MTRTSTTEQPPQGHHARRSGPRRATILWYGPSRATDPQQEKRRAGVQPTHSRGGRDFGVPFPIHTRLLGRDHEETKGKERSNAKHAASKFGPNFGTRQSKTWRGGFARPKKFGGTPGANGTLGWDRFPPSVQFDGHGQPDWSEFSAQFWAGQKSAQLPRICRRQFSGRMCVGNARKCEKRGHF